MSQKHKSSSNKTGFKLDFKKKGSWIIVALAVLVLGVNFVLSQQGKPLPEEITNVAENIVDEALQEIPAATEANSEPEATATPALQNTPTSIAAFAAESANTPAPTRPNPATTSGSESIPWAGADGDFDYYVLALSWEPAFCETKPDKIECQTQTATRYDAANFVLHGLWPNVNGDSGHTFGYCDLSQSIISQDKASDWCDLPPLSLSESVQTELEMLMPGTASCLQNHEWYKHGTCSGMSADAYFALSNRLVTLFSQTDFNRYVADNIGNRVSRRELLDRFEQEFGPGASDFLSLRCDDIGGTSMLTEVQLTLKKDLGAIDSFSNIFPAETIRPYGSCPQQFQIDRAGL